MHIFIIHALQISFLWQIYHNYRMQFQTETILNCFLSYSCFILLLCNNIHDLVTVKSCIASWPLCMSANESKAQRGKNHVQYFDGRKHMIVIKWSWVFIYVFPFSSLILPELHPLLMCHSPLQYPDQLHLTSHPLAESSTLGWAHRLSYRVLYLIRKSCGWPSH